MFAEDVGLLPNQMFTRMLRYAHTHPDESAEMARDLFRGMRSGGRIGFEDVEWFNGGLFDSDEALPLDSPAILEILKAARLDWSAIEPAIFGTLFERGLDPDKRSQLGAHYTDAESIRRLIEPVIRDPLLAEWATVKAEIAARLGKATPKARQQAADRLHGFLERLRIFRVLDPACGSGNFLYLALRTLKDIEHQVMLEAEALGLQRGFPAVGPETVLGLELNPYAAELARLTVWIGEIQWMLGHGYSLSDRPILKPLQHIECRDALLVTDEFPPCQGGVARRDGGVDTPDESNHPGATRHPSLSKEGNSAREAPWPAADAIVGNPPFLGDKKQLAELGEDYVATLRRVYAGRVPGGADLVCYWFEKARAQIEAGQTQRAGLVATNSIRGGANRPVLERILSTPSPLMGEGWGGGEKLTIFNAWSDEPWINDGAAVRVALVCFGKNSQHPFMLDGQPVSAIYADLTGVSSTAAPLDLTQARPLPENAGCSFFGLCLAGAFAVDSTTARQWLRQPNPHGRPNSDVLRPIWNGMDVTQGWKGRWVIDFGTELSEAEAALYEAPFTQVLDKVKPVRMSNREKSRVEYWWRHGRSRPELRRQLAGLTRYIATSETAKHRIFIWLPVSVAPEHKLVVIPRDDDVIFGILCSRFHATWALATGSTLEDRPVYTASVCFETFPFPEPTEPQRAAIAEAARKLHETRQSALDADPKLTLTRLYNKKPTWLQNLHTDLDAAVLAAYGWPADLADDDLLARLLALNLERAAPS